MCLIVLSCVNYIMYIILHWIVNMPYEFVTNVIIGPGL